MNSTSASPATGQRRVLVINPNSNALVTERVRELCKQYETPQLSFEVINPDTGPFSIVSDEDKLQAELQVLALIRQRLPESHDAYVLACFDDLALHAARQIVKVPVIGCCEAGISAALAVSPALAIVTTLVAALPGIRVMMQRYKAGELATVRAAGIGVDEAARSGPDAQARLMQAVQAAVLEDEAKVVLLASGGLTGWAENIGREAGVAVIDAVEAALRRAALVPEQR